MHAASSKSSLSYSQRHSILGVCNKFFFSSPSKEQAPHSPSDTLAVVKNVEFIDELVHAVAGLCDGAQVGHQTHIIALLEQNKVK